MAAISWPEILLTSAAFSILLVYHIHLVRKVRRSPLTTSVGITNHLREEWVKTVMEGHRDILAVQTLRNWTMASSFLASTAILISLGLLNAAFRPDGAAGASCALDLVGSRNETVWMIKLLVLTLNFFFAFFNFMLSIRYYNHASLGINIPEETDIMKESSPDGFVTGILNKGALHYTLGMRGYYLAVPFTLWLFGPVWLLLGAGAIVVILYRLDRMV